MRLRSVSKAVRDINATSLTALSASDDVYLSGNSTRRRGTNHQMSRNHSFYMRRAKISGVGVWM